MVLKKTKLETYIYINQASSMVSIFFLPLCLEKLAMCNYGNIIHFNLGESECLKLSQDCVNIYSIISQKKTRNSKVLILNLSRIIFVRKRR